MRLPSSKFNVLVFSSLASKKYMVAPKSAYDLLASLMILLPDLVKRLSKEALSLLQLGSLLGSLTLLCQG